MAERADLAAGAADRGAALRPAGSGSDEIHVRGDVGRTAWISCAGRLPWGQPDDQRLDDALSLTYDWEPLGRPLDVMGHPRLQLTVTSPVPVAYLSARLCDVFPDGTSALASRGVLNLAHRHGHDDLRPLEPGVPADDRAGAGGDLVGVRARAPGAPVARGRRLAEHLAAAHGCGAGGRPRRASSSTLPVLDGPSGLPAPVLPPTTGADAHAPDTNERTQPPVVWRFEDDVIADETRAVTGSGSDYDGPFGARIEERYEGTVGVSRSDDPDRPGRAARLATGSPGPKPTCAPRRDSSSARTPRRTTSSSSWSPRSSAP